MLTQSPTHSHGRQNTFNSTQPTHHADDLDAQKESSGVLDLVLDGDEEGDGLPAVDQAMVVGERQVHHGPGLDLALLGHLWG